MITWQEGGLRTEIQFCKRKRVLWMDGSEGRTTMYAILLNGTLKNGKVVYQKKKEN